MAHTDKKERILVVDDELPILKLCNTILTRKDYRVFNATTVAEAIKLLETTEVDLVITDYKMPKQSGLDLVRHVKDNYKYTEVLMITGYPSIESAINAVKTGVQEYLTKPFTTKELVDAVQRALEQQRALKLQSHDREEIAGGPPGMIGASEVMRSVFKAVFKAARSLATVLISGESGTGKELVARGIHYESPRSSSPFTPVNCGGIPEEMMDRELFGYAREGSATRACSGLGLFNTSDGGTLFFDGIDNLGLSLQAKILRVIEDREIVGPDASLQKVDVRIIASTTRDLNKMVASGTFREDLFYRINVIPIHLPCLNERGDDIILLTHHFAAKFARELGKPVPKISTRALEILKSHHYPGNVRGLENILQSLVVMMDGDTIDITDLPSHMRFSATGEGGRPRTLEEMETEYIRYVLAQAGGNKSKAAEILGIDRKTLRLKMKKLEGPDDA